MVSWWILDFLCCGLTAVCFVWFLRYKLIRVDPVDETQLKILNGLEEDPKYEVRLLGRNKIFVHQV